MRTFDTYKTIKHLQKAGFKEEQAKALVQSLLESKEYDFSKLSTKEQLAFVEERLSSKINIIEEKLVATDEKLNSKIDALRNELKADITASQNILLKWIIPFFFTTLGLIATMMFRIMSH